MAEQVTVKASSRHQSYLPRAVRQRLTSHAGDRSLVDIQDGVIVLIPQPADYVARLSGLHREVWDGVDTDTYLA